ncbi:putative protein phosphatase 2C 35 [Hibiscus syriacus]|uniref:protein-serine/threonine phosphatase n=1 Tax=Hibiscus syriacus TaxID=106335 RepID=A0A6A3D310_HIBSY|nr:putative protein phosphatase 2C 35 [Hibiscus syriacus]
MPKIYPPTPDEDSDYHRGIKPYKSKHCLTKSSLELVHVPYRNFTLQYSSLTTYGYYPGAAERENQDSFCIKTHIQGNPNVHFFGVFDGHGQYGAECSNFVKDRFVEILSSDPTLLDDPLKAYNSAFLATNSELHNSEIDDALSGTTAITVLVVGDTLYVANVGDSRAVIAVNDGDQIVAEDLSMDQTPFRKDEYDRVKLYGARVLNIEQVEGFKDPNIQNWVMKKVMMAILRGCGFRMECILGLHLQGVHLFFVVASDGVFKFLSSQTVVNMQNTKIPGMLVLQLLENRINFGWSMKIELMILQSSNSGIATDGDVDYRPRMWVSRKEQMVIVFRNQDSLWQIVSRLRDILITRLMISLLNIMKFVKVKYFSSDLAPVYPKHVKEMNPVSSDSEKSHKQV